MNTPRRSAWTGSDHRIPGTRTLPAYAVGERGIAQELLAQARDVGGLQPGMIVITDKGLSGRDLEPFRTDQVGIRLVHPDRKDEKRRYGNLAGIRQWIESVNDTLKGQLNLEGHGGRTTTTTGVYTRVAQRLVAMTAAIWHNWTLNTQTKRSLIAYDH